MPKPVPMTAECNTVIRKTTYSIASQIAFFRRRRGLTQEALAELCGMDQSHIARLETQADTAWTTPTLARVAHALDVRVGAELIPNEDVARLALPTS